MSDFDRLHPALQYHIVNSLGWSTLRSTQLEAIDPIISGAHALLLAPTAGGKTEAAVLPVLSRMLQDDWRGLSVLYLCPIKALLNNLESRLSHYAGLVGRRVGIWHGDIADSVKRRLRRDPPDILLTTPESLEGMLISPRTERTEWFGSLRVAIIDELHAFAGDDRGWHLRSVLERIDRYRDRPLQRIGLSATVRNPDSLIEWLAPTGERRIAGSSSISADAEVVIDYVGSIENAATVITRLHRGEKRLVFCDSRAVAEQLGHALRAAGVRTLVSHASLGAAERKLAEREFAEGSDCVIVATSTLELGIDVGDLDRVIQIDAPSTVSSFLQRMGRTGRRQGSRRNCLFLAISDKGLLIANALTRLWSEGWVEAVNPPPLPWNVCAQQALLIVLENGLVPQAELQQQLARCFPELPEEGLREVVQTLLEREHLFDTGGSVLQVGPAAEQEFGRGHYRDLLATFSGSDLVLGRYGTQDIGYLDPVSIAGEDAARCVLLGGRSWQVTSVDFKRRLATLEPSDQKGDAHWLGSGAVISREVAQAVAQTLREGPAAAVHASKRTRSRLEELEEAMPTPDGRYVLQEVANEKWRAWTYLGTLANRTLLASNRVQGASKSSEWYVEFKRRPPESVTDSTILDSIVADPALPVLVESLKFNELLSDQQSTREVLVRCFESVGFNPRRSLLVDCPLP